MSIFVKDPPNDPKKLLETRNQSSLKHAIPGSPSSRKHKREVCCHWLHCYCGCVGQHLDVCLKPAELCRYHWNGTDKVFLSVGLCSIGQDDQGHVISCLLQNVQAIHISCRAK